MKNRKIVIVGAGIAGAVQALLLARAGYSVTLVEARVAAGSSAGLNVRSVAVSCRSYQLLRAQALWPVGEGCAIRSVHVTERGRFGSVHLAADDLDVDFLGCVIANASLEGYLISQVLAEPAIEYICPGNAQLISNSTAGVIVVVNAKTINADLLIAADGSNSRIRESLGIGLVEKTYGQHAIVANLQCQRNHENTAYERFTDSGPLALLPLADRQVAMVYTINSDSLERLENQSDDRFLELIQQRFGGKLGRLEAVGRRAVFPLQLLVSEKQCVDSVVFIGNAARTLHPVAGQGLNLALRDVFELTARITAGGTVSQVGKDFLRHRRRDQQMVTGQTDFLARFFSHQRRSLHTPLSLFRTTSMLLLDSLPPLRAKFGALGAGIGVPVSAIHRPASSP